MLGIRYFSVSCQEIQYYTIPRKPAPGSLSYISGSTGKRNIYFKAADVGAAYIFFVVQYDSQVEIHFTKLNVFYLFCYFYLFSALNKN